MSDLTAAQIHYLDQFTSTVNEILDLAINEMRAHVPDDPHTTLTVAEQLQAACREDAATRDRIAIGFVYAIRRLARQ